MLAVPVCFERVLRAEPPDSAHRLQTLLERVEAAVGSTPVNTVLRAPGRRLSAWAGERQSSEYTRENRDVAHGYLLTL